LPSPESYDSTAGNGNPMMSRLTQASGEYQEAFHHDFPASVRSLEFCPNQQAQAKTSAGQLTPSTRLHL